MKHILKYLHSSIMLFAFVLTAALSSAQTLMNLDSLLLLENSAQQNMDAVDLYIQIGQQYENNDLPRAKAYYLKALQLSKQLESTEGEIRFIHNYTYALNLEGKFDSSLMLNLKAVELSKASGDTLNLAKALFNTGSVYRYTGDYEKAISFYLEGEKWMTHAGDLRLAAQLNDLLQVLYSDLRQYDKSIEYGQKAVDWFRKSGDLNLLGVSLNNLAITYSRSGDMEKATSMYREILELGKRMNDRHMEGTALLNMGDTYLKQGRYEEMGEYFRQALEIFRELKAPEGMVVALRGMSLTASGREDYEAARELARESADLATRHNLREQQQKSLATLGHTYYALHDMKAAEEVLRLSASISDSLLNESVRQQILETESKFKTENQQNQISRLETEKKLQEYSIREKVLIIQTLLGITFTLLVVGFLGYRNYKNRQKLQQQRIRELETEKMLDAAEAVLKGEEQERSRLAKELHDGLGGMLSGVKFSMQNIRGNLVLTPENAQQFERNLDMLDSSIREMRRVAHNLMPETLFRFGLDAALREFCESITLSGALTIQYQSFGMDPGIPEQSLAISAYRIVQELVHNTLKHASATLAMVQLSRAGDLLLVDVEDNGKGFDPEKTHPTKGMGWSNIRKRIDYLNGKLTLHAKPGKGTSVHIELNLSPHANKTLRGG